MRLSYTKLAVALANTKPPLLSYPADILTPAREDAIYHSQLRLEIWRRTVLALADVLQLSNTSFDRRRFLTKACFFAGTA